MGVFGRLKEGVTVSQADAAIKTIATRLEEQYPDVNDSRSATVTRFTPLFNPAQEDQLRMVGLLMMIVVGMVLLIACVNVANLLLARASVREKEIGVRLALGAGRRRLIRQLLTESTLLALVGGALGLLFAFWGRDLLWQVRPPFIPDDAIDLTIDRTVLLYTIGLSLLTGVVFGLFPSLQSTKTNLTDTLHGGGRSGGYGRRHQRMRAGLVVAEISLAVVTLICAGLFIRSMQAAQQINPGFDTERIASMFLNPAGIGYSEEQTEQIYRDVIEKAAAIGGVASAAVSSNPPLGGGLMRSVIPEGEESSDNRGILTMNTTISPGYFKTMGIPMLRGRDFTEFDTSDVPAVAIINRATQQRFWPDEDPIGKRFTFITEEFKIEVVGIVQDTLVALGQPAQPTVYLPYKQRFAGAINLIIRSHGDPAAQLGAVQDAIRALDSDLAATNVRTIGQTLGQALWAPRFGAALLGVFGFLALGLAMVGIFGVMSYSVSQRTREIGVRIALGAQGKSILRLVVRQGMLLVAVGLVIGLALAFAASRALTSMLYEISAADPVAFIGISGLLCLAAMLACYLPARRATKIDPIVALRQE
jgi:putative ABC transport system permease protein